MGFTCELKKCENEKLWDLYLQTATLNYSHKNVSRIIFGRLNSCLDKQLLAKLIKSWQRNWLFHRVFEATTFMEIWIATLRELLICQREIGNVVDRYAVAVKNDMRITVGRLPRKIFQLCSIFIEE